MPLLLLCLAACLAAPAAASEPRLWWVFLTKGPKRDQAPADLERGQKAHLANLERLYKAGVGVLAGPLGDDGPIRGIVVVKARSREELTAHFEPDPFVQWGRLAVDASPWSGTVEGLGKPAEPFALQKATLAILRKGPAWSASAAALERQHAETRERLRREGALALAGDLSDGGDRVAVLLFRTADPARVEQMLAADPAVRAGHLAVELHPQFVGKGMIGEDPLASPVP